MPWEKGFDEQQALGQAMEVFWAKGFDSASIADLLKGTGLNRGSLYGTFGDKRSLFLKALQKYDAERRRPLLAELEALDDPMKAIECFFSAIVTETVQDAERKGCFLFNTALDLASHDDQVQRIVNNGVREIEGFLRRCIEVGQVRGQIAEDISADDMPRLLLSAVVGIRLLGRSVFDEAALQSIADQAVLRLTV